MLGGKSVNTETETELIGNLPIGFGNYRTEPIYRTSNEALVAYHVKYFHYFFLMCK